MLLTEAEAQQIAKRFLLDTYFDSKIDFTDCLLIGNDNAQAYQLRGKITMRSRSPMSRFVAAKSADRYEFRIEINAQQSEVINYEII